MIFLIEIPIFIQCQWVLKGHFYPAIPHKGGSAEYEITEDLGMTTIASGTQS